jgi:hypothetical protein
MERIGPGEYLHEVQWWRRKAIVHAALFNQ